MTEHYTTPNHSHLGRETRLAYQTPAKAKEIVYINEWWIPKFETYKMDLWARVIAVFENLHIIWADRAREEVKLILKEEKLPLDRAKELAWRVWFVIKSIFEMPEHETSN